MPINRLYHTWIHRIHELRPGQRITQVRAFTWLIVGIYFSRSVYLSRIAGKVPGKAKLLSTVRRLSRLLDNPAIRGREWYAPIAKQWRAAQLQHLGEIRLIVDGTKIGFAHQLLIVGIAYRKRSLPIAGTWVQHVKGHRRAPKQLPLFSWSGIANSGRLQSCDNSIIGIGSMFSGKNQILVSGSLKRQAGNLLVAIFRK